MRRVVLFWGTPSWGIERKVVIEVAAIERMLVTLATGRGLLLVGGHRVCQVSAVGVVGHSHIRDLASDHTGRGLDHRGSDQITPGTMPC